MTAVARLFVFTLTLVALGSGSACLTTLCLSALCGDPQTSAQSARTVDAVDAVDADFESERSDHSCNPMRF